ncbi:hypothetical protein [Mesomycoplasma ovipneumoniae]|uniref:hypothetical protein n=1 Tax=Mesomycoplasma ovipneumoniae TaxID=29562 RepID=UPI00311A8E61
MKKQQQNLSPLQLEAKKIANKYAEYKKVKIEDFHNEISHMFKNIVEEILKSELSLHLGYEKSDQSKNGVHSPISKTGFEQNCEL